VHFSNSNWVLELVLNEKVDVGVQYESLGGCVQTLDHAHQVIHIVKMVRRAAGKWNCTRVNSTGRR